MTNWAILNISPTDDREAVRRAYMTMLPSYNPEDDPEGFIRLRSAYEEILQELDNASSEDTTPMAAFLLRLEEVYADFARRSDTEEWKELLKDDLCQRLDLEDETGSAILTFLMKHYYLPQEVWNLLNSHFDWQSKANDLKQEFPADFIEFVFTSARHSSLRYDLFEADGEANYDRWIWLYYEMEALLHATDDPDYLEMKQEIEAIPIRHLYYDMHLARMHIANEEPEAALSKTRPVFEALPEDTQVRYVHALALLAFGDVSCARGYFEDILAKDPENFAVKKSLIEAMIAHENQDYYEKARVLLLEILDKYPYSPFALHMFRVTTEELARIYEEKYNRGDKNADTVLTLAKHYLNSSRYEKCQEILEKLDASSLQAPDYPVARYYEYLADCYAAADNFDLAIPLYEKNVALERCFRNYVKMITALVDTGKFGQALVKVEEALLTEDEDTLSLAYLYDNKGLIYHQLGQYYDALEAYDKGLDINGWVAHIYLHKARTCRYLNRSVETIECCECAIAIFPYMTEAYTIQLELFYESNLYDRMLALAELADRTGFENPVIRYHKACALCMLGQLDKAVEIADELENLQEEHLDIPYLYNLIGDKYADSFNDVDSALKYYQLSIKRSPNDAHAAKKIEELYLSHLKKFIRSCQDFINKLSSKFNL